VTKEELATKLNGREYGEEITPKEEAEAKASGLVVIFGASDDLMEFRGAINDETGVYEGGIVYLNSDGLLSGPDCCDDPDDCPFFKKEASKAKVVEAIWNDGIYSWVYETKIPHATFDIMEDGEKYCRGIVLKLSEIS